MAARHEGGGRRYPAPYRALAGFIVASAAFVAIFVALTLSAFHKPTPHDLPVGIVGSAAVTRQIEHALDSAAPGAFRFRSYPSEASATTGIAQREVDGALVASGANLRLLVTQAGGTGPEQALSGAFAAVAARSGRHLVVSDVVPPRASDSQALSSWFVVLSVLIPSLAAGSASALAFRHARRGWAVAAPVAAAVVSGAVAAAIADGIAGLGNYAAIAGIVALFSLAVAAPTAVLARIRPPLVALAVLAFIVFGIPASGGPANLASFTPGFLRVLSPVLPLGIAAGSIRNVVYFGGHATSAYIWTLAAWALAGVAGLILVTALRRPAPALTEPVMPPPVLAEPVPARPGHAPVPVPGIPDPRTAQSVTLVVGFDDSGRPGGRSSGPRTSSGRAPAPCTSSTPTMCSSTATCPDSAAPRWTRTGMRRPPVWLRPLRRPPPRQARRTRSSAARNRPQTPFLTQPAFTPPPSPPAHPLSSPAALIMSRTASLARCQSGCCTSRPTRCSPFRERRDQPCVLDEQL